MPLLLEPPRTGPKVVAHSSVAVEIEWALASSQRADWARDHPGLGRALSGSPHLAGRIARLWPDDLTLSCGGYLELMVLAHQGGVLFSDEPSDLLGNLDHLARHSVHPTELGSETDDDLRVIQERLRLLRESDTQRREYVATMTELWDAVGPLWENEGRAHVERSVARRRRLVEAGRPWLEVVGDDFALHLEEVQRTVEAMKPTDKLAVVPAYFTHLGLMVDLPGTFLLGVRISPMDPRAATEDLARRLKAIADPTRLAIVAHLARTPCTVSDLTDRFDVAQPTMSNHVKLLRQAGLVTNRSEGGRRHLVLSPGAGEVLVSEFAELLGRS